METPLTVQGFTNLIADNGRVQVYLWRNVATGDIHSGFVEFRYENETLWRDIFEVFPSA